MRTLTLVAGLLATLAAFAAVSDAEASDEGDAHDGCRKPKPIAGYKVTFQGEDIFLPGYVTIRRNGKILYADPKIVGWEPPYTSARYAIVGQMLLVLTESTDCIDLTEQRLFILRKGAKAVHQPVWTSNWKDGFFLENDRLTYWSEWFCRSEDKERKPGMSYVYSFSEQRQTFERLDVPTERYCSSVAERRFLIFHELPVAER